MKYFDEFYDMVVAAVSEIPKGYITTYGIIADMIGYPQNARKVGTMMGRVCESGIPCHRVVRSDGELAPFYAFSGHQRQLLEAEGITFLKNGRVDVKKHLWRVSN